MENEIILGWEPLAGISLRSLLFLASEKGFIVLKRLLTDGFSKGIGGVFTFQEVNVQKSFDTDIMELFHALLGKIIKVICWPSSRSLASPVLLL